MLSEAVTTILIDGLEDSKAVKTPMENNLDIGKTSSNLHILVLKFQSLLVP